MLLSFVLYGIVISRIFAYYNSADNVTNRISGKSIGLELYEPEWDAVGAALARNSEPGMVIPKDPYAQNTGALDEVVRLKMTIRLKPTTATPTFGNDQHEDMLQVATDTERKIAILRAILYDNGDSFMKIEKATPPLGVNEVLVDTGAEGVWKVQYQGKDFLIEAADGTGSESFDFYFYYIGNNIIGGSQGYEDIPPENTCMETLPPGATTSKLFNQLVYPIYKKDYLTVFDQGYDIQIYAEGILCRDFSERGLEQTVASFKQIAAE